MAREGGGRNKGEEKESRGEGMKKKKKKGKEKNRRRKKGKDKRGGGGGGGEKAEPRLKTSSIDYSRCAGSISLKSATRQRNCDGGHEQGQ